MKTPFFLVVLSTLCAAQATQPTPEEQRRAQRDAVMKPVVYRLPGMEKVKPKTDVVYRQDGDTKLLMDVYTPVEKPAGRGFPVVLFIHGGVPPNVTPKDWRFYQDWGRLAAASGFVGVTFNHRLGFPDPHMEEAAADVAAALAYVGAHAAEFKADPSRVCLAAYSAGGPLLADYMHAPENAKVRCLVAFYPILDIRESQSHKPSMTADALQRFSNAVQARDHAAEMPPIFLARAGHDQIPGLLGWMDVFLREAIAHNAPLTLMIHPTGVHGFDNQNDDDRSREIIAAALAFMKKHLR